MKFSSLLNFIRFAQVDFCYIASVTKTFPEFYISLWGFFVSGEWGDSFNFAHVSESLGVVKYVVLDIEFVLLSARLSHNSNFIRDLVKVLFMYVAISVEQPLRLRNLKKYTPHKNYRPTSISSEPNYMYLPYI